MDAEETAYHYSKARLPAGESYPLKRGELDAALREHSVTTLRTVYLSRRGGTHLLTARFIADHRHMAASGSTSLSVCSVPSDLRRDIRAALLDGGLDRVIRWLAAVEHAAETWRLQGHQFGVEYRTEYGGTDGALRFSGDEVLGD
jgi:hypothetical protein